MSEDSDPLDAIFSQIKQARDEMKLKAHLAGMDVQSEFKNLEEKLREVEELKPVIEKAEGAERSARDAAVETLDHVALELAKGYQKLREKLTQ